MTVPLVSICCITYNHASYIEKAMESFLRQKCNFKYEIIIGEDKSTDKTYEIVNKYKEKFPEIIKIITSEKNVGMMENLFRVLDAAKGKYIALCEGDDYWTDSLKLQKQLDFMERNPEYTLCGHASQIIHESGEDTGEIIRPFVGNNTVDLDAILSQSGILFQTASFFIKKELFNQGYPSFIKNSHVGDYPLQLWAFDYGLVYYMDEIMSVYRKGSINSWSQKNEEVSNEHTIQVLKKTIKLLKAFDEYSKKKFTKRINKEIHNISWKEKFINGKVTFQQYPIVFRTIGYKLGLSKILFYNYPKIYMRIKVIMHFFKI